MPLGIRQRFFTQRVIGPWSRLPRELGTAPSLTVLEVFGQYSQGHGGIFGGGALWGQELDSILEGPFQLRIISDSVTWLRSLAALNVSPPGEMALRTKKIFMQQHSGWFVTQAAQGRCRGACARGFRTEVPATAQELFLGCSGFVGGSRTSPARPQVCRDASEEAAVRAERSAGRCRCGGR